jgi:AcrR family transcriptional regulator
MDVAPRKVPRQARAKVTVDAIIEATTQVLLEDGYDRFSTARAAERAGVSVGSLYQYFPNKAALTAAVIQRCCDQFLVVFERALAGRRRVTLTECIRAIVDVTLVSHELTPALHKIVFELAPRIGVGGVAEYASRTATAAIVNLLRGHTDEIAPGVDVATAAVVINTVLEGLSHQAVNGHPAQLPAETLAKEATRLIVNYLTVGDAGSA